VVSPPDAPHPQDRAGEPAGAPPEPGCVATPREVAEAMARRLLAATGTERPALLDPACGSGDLLLAALDAAGGDARFAAERLFGIERRPELALAARARLAEHVGGGPDVRAALERHVVCADALDPRCPWPAGTHVLANPPWVSFSGRRAVELTPEQRARYRRTWASFESWPSLHGPFLERIAAHLAGWRGHACVALPAAVCELAGYGPLRAAVSEHAALEGPPADLGERVFPGVVQGAVLIDLRGRARRGPPDPAPWARLDAGDRRLLARLSELPRLPPESFRDAGVHTGNAGRVLIAPRPADEAWAPIRAGRDLRAFELAPPRLWLRTDLAPGGPLRFRVAPLDSYRRFPVLLRQTARRPVAALHLRPTYFRNSLLACAGAPRLHPAFVTAVLNGPVAGAWHRIRFRDARQRAFPQVKIAHLRSQPFPIRCRSEAPAVHDALVAAVAALRRAVRRGCSADERAGHEAGIRSRALAAFALDRELEERVLAWDGE